MPCCGASQVSVAQQQRRACSCGMPLLGRALSCNSFQHVSAVLPSSLPACLPADVEQYFPGLSAELQLPPDFPLPTHLDHWQARTGVPLCGPSCCQACLASYRPNNACPWPLPSCERRARHTGTAASMACRAPSSFMPTHLTRPAPWQVGEPPCTCRITWARRSWGYRTLGTLHRLGRRPAACWCVWPLPSPGPQAARRIRGSCRCV